MRASSAIVLNGQFIAPANTRSRGSRPRRYRTAPFGEHPIGNGPFRGRAAGITTCIVRNSPNENETYWRGAPKIKRIAIRIILNPDQYAEAMDEGTGDLAENHVAVARIAKLVLDPRRLPVRARAGSLRALDHDQSPRSPGLDDVAVRRAMNYGVGSRVDLTQPALPRRRTFRTTRVIAVGALAMA